jgi:hypothetical protein
MNLDPRVDNYFMMSSPLPTMVVTIIYCLIVYFGPRIMKHREPFKLSFILKAYNLFVCLLSGYLVYEVRYFYSKDKNNEFKKKNLIKASYEWLVI